MRCYVTPLHVNHVRKRVGDCHQMCNTTVACSAVDCDLSVVAMSKIGYLKHLDKVSFLQRQVFANHSHLAPRLLCFR